ncbi:hypothetical protein GGS23DRAFT_549969 [Durotheca rogersii]|uniref:uncharacterized protein n=1 Tax=Durotheca rogersii TaxID=419775 RepID=UPI00221EB6B5|nr:uncharacterized protein GGS23DRAFT_549969 [Durotheca rogersii]KAI5867788.1 hypothetical protein GGS23DRAFT_549969 [Durotheca rogersii]
MSYPILPPTARETSSNTRALYTAALHPEGWEQISSPTRGSPEGTRAPTPYLPTYPPAGACPSADPDHAACPFPDENGSSAVPTRSGATGAAVKVSPLPSPARSRNYLSVGPGRRNKSAAPTPAFASSLSSFSHLLLRPLGVVHLSNIRKQYLIIIIIKNQPASLHQRTRQDAADTPTSGREPEGLPRNEEIVGRASVGIAVAAGKPLGLAASSSGTRREGGQAEESGASLQPQGTSRTGSAAVGRRPHQAACPRRLAPVPCRTAPPP